jgi:hypothetical protein
MVKNPQENVSHDSTLTKEDIKKLELIKDLSPKQVQEILHYNSIAKKTDKVELVTEEM